MYRIEKERDLYENELGNLKKLNEQAPPQASSLGEQKEEAPEAEPTELEELKAQLEQEKARYADLQRERDRKVKTIRLHDELYTKLENQKTIVEKERDSWEDLYKQQNTEKGELQSSLMVERDKANDCHRRF